MFFAPNPGILAAGVPTGKTYAEWLAHEAAKPNTVRTWGASGSWIAETIRTTCGTVATSLLVGSSWMSRFRGNSGSSAPDRLVQHAMPSQAVFNQQCTDGRDVFFDVVAAANGAFSSLDRNGFLSSSSANTTPAFAVSKMRYFDPALGPVEIQPSLGLGPTPYDW